METKNKQLGEKEFAGLGLVEEQRERLISFKDNYNVPSKSIERLVKDGYTPGAAVAIVETELEFSGRVDYETNKPIYEKHIHAIKKLQELINNDKEVDKTHLSNTVIRIRDALGTNTPIETANTYEKLFNCFGEDYTHEAICTLVEELNTAEDYNLDKTLPSNVNKEGFEREMTQIRTRIRKQRELEEKNHTKKEDKMTEMYKKFGFEYKSDEELLKEE